MILLIHLIMLEYSAPCNYEFSVFFFSEIDLNFSREWEPVTAGEIQWEPEREMDQFVLVKVMSIAT